MPYIETGKMFRIAYPTHAADFLSNLEHESMKCVNGIQNDKSEKVQLCVIVVGAGLGGLAAAIAIARAGHKVTVLEAAPRMDEIGAGINITPNSGRLLRRWGFEKTIAGRAVEPEEIMFRRWQNGSPIGKTALVPEFRLWFDAPYWVVHRAHFLDAMYQLALSWGVEVQLSSQVTKVDFDVPFVTIRDRGILKADLVVGADGIKSNIRTQMLKSPPALSDTGFAAYRATVPVEEIANDPVTAHVVEKSSLDMWIGPGRHIVGYMIAGGSTYNLVLSHPETSDPETWDQSTAKDEMHRQFDGWDPVVSKIISFVTFTRKWPLKSLPPLDTWVSDSGKAVIMGDAAHPMLPYMSQGAAQAVEDAAVLGKCLERVRSSSQLPISVLVYEKLRKERASQVQEASRINGIIWHFDDGPEQEARDRGSEAEVKGDHFITSTNQWSDPTTQLWLYAYDAEKEVRQNWEQLSQQLTRARQEP